MESGGAETQRPKYAISEVSTRIRQSLAAEIERPKAVSVFPTYVHVDFAVSKPCGVYRE
jgi:hypothetical protein